MQHRAATGDEQRKPFVLCADDYALSPAVSRGILALLAAGRLSATGVMTNRPSWPSGAADLKAFGGEADLGVHLNLTCGAPLAPMPLVAPDGRLPPLARLARLALQSQKARREIADELKRQVDAFAAALGRPPDFLDGHQHAHALPGIRGGTIEVARKVGGAIWLRDPADSLAAILKRGRSAAKAAMVAKLAAGFGRAARAAGFRTNSGFSGFSAFDPAADYADEFAAALRAPGAAHLVMCHPGEIDDELREADPVVETRPRELAFLASERFIEICAGAGLRVARMKEARRPTSTGPVASAN